MSADAPSLRLAARAVGAVGRGARAVDRARARLTFPLTAPPTPGGAEPLPKRSRTGMDYDTDWARTAPARYARVLLLEGPVRLAVEALAAPEQRGLDRLADLMSEDEPGPVIFAANHHSHLDAPLLFASIPHVWRHRTVVAGASDYFFENRIKGTLAALALNAIPMDRQKVNRRSANLAASLIKDGWSLAIFPEGGRSRDGWGQPFHGGAAFLAVRCNVPVVPIHLAGTGAIAGRGVSRPRPGKATVTFGAPMRSLDGDARRFNRAIEQAVAELGDEAASDWWTARRRAAGGVTPSLSGPEATSWRRSWALSEQRRAEKRRRRQRRAWPDLDD